MKYYEEVTGTIFVTLELTDNYGPGDSRPKFINLVIDAVRKNEVFRMSPGEQEICYLFVDDTVNAFITCMELLASGEISENSHFSVYADEVLRLKDLVALVADQMQVSLKTEAGFYPYRDREIMTYQPTFPRLPHWEPKVSLKEGIARIIAGNQNK
jgi:nucleoside-diphosphate-sugar epimerase